MINKEEQLKQIITKYHKSFSSKKFNEDAEQDIDLLMGLYGLTVETKRENKQYWNRELGSIFELLCSTIFSDINGYKPKENIGNDSPYDFILNDLAIDTKYRVGSGDAGTLKKFKAYGSELKSMGYVPTILLLRTDSLPAALTALYHGGWKIYQGDECFDFIKSKSGFDLKKYLIDNQNKFIIKG